MTKLFDIALEEDTSGSTLVEKELVFYARIDSIAPLMAAAESIVSQEQFQVRIAREGVEDHKSLPRLRVRSTKQHDKTEIEYTQTLKIKNGDHDLENTIIITKEYYDQFRTIAENGMEKTRYTLAIPDREEKWEVDVFFNEDGKPYNYVKIDYEFKGSNTDYPKLPDYFHDVITGTTTDVEEKELITKLYETVFLKKF